MEHSFFVKDEGFYDLNPIQFGYERCVKSHFYGPAVRTYWLIHFVVSGFGFFKINDKEYKVNPGEMFVIPPYVETYYEADANTPWSYIWIGFTSKTKLPKELPDVILCPEAENIFNEMKKCTRYSMGRSAYLNSKLWELFTLLLEVGNNKSDKYSYIEKALEFIHANYMQNITVEKISQLLNLDRTYFSVIFKKEIGIPPKQYLINYRMNIAATLLVEKNFSIFVTANSVGYSDSFTFSKIFKRHFGTSPSSYVTQQRTKIATK